MALSNTFAGSKGTMLNPLDLLSQDVDQELRKEKWGDCELIWLEELPAGKGC